MQTTGTFNEATRVLIVSRHPATVRWLLARISGPAEIVPHLSPAEVDAGDHVVGTLPVSLAAEICARGAIFWQVCFHMPVDWRGMELSDGDLADLGPVIRRFDVRALPGDNVTPFTEPCSVSRRCDDGAAE